LRASYHAVPAIFENRDMPTEPPSTTPILLLPVSSATAKRKSGPLATSWHSNKFLDPVTDGVVLPILHLNGYKIANPCILGRANRISGRWVRSNGNRPVANALALQ
jgi:XFP N-terminal domain